MNIRAKASLVIIVLLAAVIAVAFLSGVQNPSAAPGSRLVSVKILDMSPYPSSANEINVTYSSVGIHVVSASYTGWEYYNTTQSASLTQNSTYQVAEFSVPYNCTIDQIELNILSSNVSIAGSAYPASSVNGRLYSNVSQTQHNSTSTILLGLSQAPVPVINGASLSFAVRPYLYPAVTNGSGAQISVSNVSLSQSSNVTRLSLTVNDNSASPVVIDSVIISGNLIVTGNVSSTSVLEGIASSVLNSSALQGVLPSGASQGLNLSDIPGVGQVGGVIANNSGLFSSIENSLPPNIKGIISSSGSSSTGISLNNLSAAEQYVSQINITAYKSILIQSITSADSKFNQSYLSNQNIQELESMVGNLGGVKNDSIYNGITSGVITSEYNQYIGKASALRSAESGLGEVGLAVTASGTLVPTSYTASSPSAGLTIAPAHSATLTFNGVISAGPPGTSFAVQNDNTYKIIVLGNSSIASATAVST